MWPAVPSINSRDMADSCPVIFHAEKRAAGFIPPGDCHPRQSTPPLAGPLVRGLKLVRIRRNLGYANCQGHRLLLHLQPWPTNDCLASALGLDVPERGPEMHRVGKIAGRGGHRSPTEPDRFAKVVGALGRFPSKVLEFR